MAAAQPQQAASALASNSCACPMLQSAALSFPTAPTLSHLLTWPPLSANHKLPASFHLPISCTTKELEAAARSAKNWNSVCGRNMVTS